MNYQTPDCFGKYTHRTYASCMSCPIDTVRRCQNYSEYVDEIDAVQIKVHDDMQKVIDSCEAIVNRIKSAFA